MTRALVLLTCGALLTLVVEVTDTFREPWQEPRALVLAGAFTLVATLGFAWVRGRGPAWALAYVAVQLALGMATFGAARLEVGATLLMVVLVMQAVVLLGLPAAVVVAAVVPLGHLGMSAPEGLRAGLGTLAAVVFGLVLAQLLVREQRARDQLAEAHAQLRGYAAQAEQLATTQERNRLARDIHDGLGHHLTVVQMQLQAARAVLASDSARTEELLAKAQGQAEAALAEVRRSVSALRDPAAARPLRDSLRGLTEEASAAGVPAELEIAGPARPLPADAEEALFRAAQEGLTNVRKHARASRASVVLDYRDPAAVAVEVRDDGVGTDPRAGPPLGFGLLGAQERAARIGGRLRVDSAPGRGLALRVEVPG